MRKRTSRQCRVNWPYNRGPFFFLFFFFACVRHWCTGQRKSTLDKSCAYYIGSIVQKPKKATIRVFLKGGEGGSLFHTALSRQCSRNVYSSKSDC